jgi:hypothetical protein
MFTSDIEDISVLSNAVKAPETQSNHYQQIHQQSQPNVTIMQQM